MRGARARAERPPPPDQGPQPGRIEVAGEITGDTRWDTATVAVVGDVRVLDGATLAIAPGVRVEFQGHHSLAVDGTLYAVGTPQHPIVFTAAHPELFTLDHSTQGCWNGIRFIETRATNEPSRLAWCVLEYGKATGTEATPYPYGGGVLSVVDFSELTIENCILRHNLAEQGGALFLYRNASPRLVGNLIVDNHALVNGAAIYCGYAQPKLINNTITANRIHNLATPYEDTGAVRCFLAKPLLVNDILHDNVADVPVGHRQVWGGKLFYEHHNAIERQPAAGTNFPDDPLFVDPANGDWRLRPDSPCVDAGGDPGPGIPARTQDLAGSPVPVDGDLDRIETVDIGALELVPLAVRGQPVIGAQVVLEFLVPPRTHARLFAVRGETLPVPLSTRYGELDLDPERLLPLGETVLTGPAPILVPLALPDEPAAVGSPFSLQVLLDGGTPGVPPAWSNALELVLEAPGS